MVATSAFGMGVDKDGMVIHYEISNSLENYVRRQEGQDGTRPYLQLFMCYSTMRT